MQRLLLLGALTAISILSTHAANFKFGAQTLTVPDGFEVEQVAGPPLVDRPVTADFDEQGRLYVTDSSGTNEKVDKQLQDKPHRVLRLEDQDGDGRFDHVTVFADHMMFPEGCLWLNGSLYVAAPPSIWKLTDTDGDGIADQREEWFQGKTLTGCANDLHGPYFGPDGWIYWCKGAFAQQTYPRPGKTPFVTRAAHIFRARLDGSGIEPLMTGGMDNPVSVTFTPGGECILTGTFFVNPGGGHRDGLIHAVYGGVYGKDHDVIYDHPRTGDLMPIMTHHGPAASCFVLRYQSGVFGPEYRDNLFACLFNLHKVVRHVLVPDGATFKTKDEDFLVSDNPDFHPTDVLEDADGSLLVVDTGGWYKICCPTSQLWKPDVLGAIYRVRKTGAPKVEDPRGLKLAWANQEPAQLARLLDDARLAVRNRAIAELARQGQTAVPVLKQELEPSHSPLARLNAVWTLTRIDNAEARQAVHAALSDQDPEVVSAALHSVALWRDESAPKTQLFALLESGKAGLRREAAEAVGRIGGAESVRALLSSAAVPPLDRVLEHSITYALIEIGDKNATAPGLDSPSSSVHRAALIALDQMENGGLEPQSVTPLLGSSDPILKQTAIWIVSHHPEWAKSLAGYFQKRLEAEPLPPPEETELEHQLGQFARDARIQELILAPLRYSADSKSARLAALHAMALANLKPTPPEWVSSVAQVLGSSDAAELSAAVAAVRTWPESSEDSSQLKEPLRAVSNGRTLPIDLRLAALAAMPGGLESVDSQTLGLLKANLDLAKPVMIRSTAASVLAKARLTDAQLAELADALPSSGPMEVPRLLSAFQKSQDEAVGMKLVDALKHSAGLAGLRADTLKAHLTNFPEKVQEASVPLLVRLNADAAKEQTHLDELLKELPAGDVRRGQAVFNSQKAACSTCHAIGYLGGNVGPDLTRIGQIRTERDLLESVVYPSASFVRSFEPLVVTTKSGDDYSGVLRRDAPEEIVLATGPGADVHIARGDIAEMRPGTVSVMPAGLEQILSQQELADVVAFLRATRW